MGLLQFLFGTGSISKKMKFRQVDWSAVEARWSNINQLANSTDQSQSKQALIQADMLIDDILKQADVPGTTMGERLKQISGKVSKETYNQLWQAHKKRNELVHEHGSFVAKWEIEKYISSFQAAVSELRGNQ